MALFDFTITDSDAGRNLGVPDWFLVSLGMLTAPSYETPTWNEGRMHWRSGDIELRGSRASRSLICFSPAQNGAVIGSPAIGVTGKIFPAMLVRDGSLDYRGDLVVLCVPKGGAFTITLSDTPVAKGTQPVGEQEAFIRRLLAQSAAKALAATAATAAKEPHGAQGGRDPARGALAGLSEGTKAHAAAA